MLAPNIVVRPAESANKMLTGMLTKANSAEMPMAGTTKADQIRAMREASVGRVAKPPPTAKIAAPKPLTGKKKKARAAYQRDLMRKRRAEAKAPKEIEVTPAMIEAGMLHITCYSLTANGPGADKFMQIGRAHV